MDYNILVINPGSTSTKISVYRNQDEVLYRNIEHSIELLKSCQTLAEQYPLRKKLILELLEDEGIELKELDAVAARGGTFGKVAGGAYLVDEELVNACKKPLTNHPSNLAAIIAYDIGKEVGIDAYIYDAVCVDEVKDIAKFTGIKGLDKKPNSHVLNTRAVCRKVALAAGKSYKRLNFVVAHIGGGISINVHERGRIIDVISDDAGPMSPERAGLINSMTLANMCYSGQYTQKQMMKMLRGEGGLISHLGTNSAIEVEKRIINGDIYAKEVYEAMAYQIANGIGGLSTAVKGKVDYILLTGGIAHSNMLTQLIMERVDYIAPIQVLPGAIEMYALADGILRVLQGKEEIQRYRHE